MGNTVSDLFYPDNPNRRKRAEGLRQDILQFVEDFEREKQKKYEPLCPPIHFPLYSPAFSLEKKKILTVLSLFLF